MRVPRLDTACAFVGAALSCGELVGTTSDSTHEGFTLMVPCLGASKAQCVSLSY